MKNKSEKVLLVVLTAILVCSAFSVTSAAAQPVEVWNVTWPGLGTAVATTEDSVYLAGANTNGTDVFLNKYDKDGNLLWNSTWEMFAPGVGGSDVATMSAAGDSVYLAGACVFSKGTDLNAFLNQYDSDGNFLWNITWGGTGATIAYATAAAEDCVYVAGETAPSNVSDFDAFLNKYDKDGNLLWNSTWGGPGTYFASATATSGDGVYVAGREGHKAFLNKYDTDGNLLWNTSVMSVGGIAAGDHVVYSAGTSFPDACLNKYSSTDGSLIWNITDSTMSHGSATAAIGDSVYLAGANESSDLDFSNASLTKYNSTDGSFIWNITWGKAGWVNGRAVAATNDCVYLAGTSASSFLDANGSAFLVKYSEPTPVPTVTPVPTLTPTPTPTLATTAPIETPTVPPAATPSATPTPPGFEAVFAIAGLLAVAFLVWIKRRN